MKNQKPYYLGLDIGTDSVGYAVTDKEYNLLKFHGEPAWGVTLFDEASLNSDRRSFRTARRRLDRRQQRVTFVQELFAPEISKKDERFFIRLKESALYREDTGDRFTLFNDEDFTDAEYYKKYPTVHHLISELINSSEPHDVRLVYLACAWLVSHRGHFLSNIDRNNLSGIKDFETVYNGFIDYFTKNEYAAPWNECDITALGNVLKTRQNITGKNKAIVALVYGGKNPSKEAGEDFPFSRQAVVKLLAGGTVKLKELFCNDDYDEFGSVSLSMDDDKMAEIAGNIGDDFDMLTAMRSVYDWAVLVDVLGESATVSEAKVKQYEQHKADLAFLKRFIKKYKPGKYDEVFRAAGKDNYAAYAYHSDEGTAQLKKKNKEDFSKYLTGIVKDVPVREEDEKAYADMLSRLELRTFLPKQKDTDNRVIPHQLYWYELDSILKNAVSYLPFLSEKDESGYTVSEKLEKIFLFRIPYFVGPLNEKSEYSWFVRKNAGKITPWNFEEKVDLDESENEFIRRMTNKCTYLPGEDVLPKSSLLYHRFTVLNEINNLKINGEKISVELKQDIYNNVFLAKKKITRKYLTDYLKANNYLEKGNESALTGIDINITSNLEPQIAFRRLFENGVLTESDAEKIIERASYAEDKTRLKTWLEKNYPSVNEDDRNYICKMKLKDFGRLSRRFLEELEGVNKATGEVTTVIGALWNTQNNLMEIIADEKKFDFALVLRDFSENYYRNNKKKLSDRLDDMYLSNAVRRPVYRTLDVVKDIVKVFGEPEKIFIEMTRGATEEQKGKRTKSRKEQILELYQKCKDEDVKLLKSQLDAMGDYADNRLQGDKLFLYYMQLGKCMYTGKPIDIARLATKEYDIDHIYPQAYVKDDSVINNKVLVLSEENGKKSDVYPIAESIRHSMKGYWDYLKNTGLISEEKYKRLVRATPFTAEEKQGFIARQLVETSQSTKAVATLLKERFPEAKTVYCKARLTSEFRQEFDLLKSRSFNDLHHAKDAYLNIVTGNVYDMKFTSKWFNVNSSYSIKTGTLFTHPVICGNETVWDGTDMLSKVKKTVGRNNAHFTKFAFFKKGGFFDQMPVAAADGLVPLKKGLPTEKYGGYNRPGAMFYIPVKYKCGKKTEIIIMSVELLYGDKFLSDSNFAREYCFTRLKYITGKTVEEVSFPMGMRPWKVNTVLSLDGFRVCITGIAGGGKNLIAQPAMQFSADRKWETYIKRLERFTEKLAANEKYIYSEEYDKISPAENIQLYDLYLDKLENTVYSKRVNCPVEILRNGRELFEKLDVREQAKALMNVQQIFGRNSNGINLSAIGGTVRAASTVSFSATISNWKKTYKDVHIVDSSVSGLRSKQSENLLELI